MKNQHIGTPTMAKPSVDNAQFQVNLQPLFAMKRKALD
jgi:hypothetical protein